MCVLLLSSLFGELFRYLLKSRRDSIRAGRTGQANGVGCRALGPSCQQAASLPWFVLANVLESGSHRNADLLPPRLDGTTVGKLDAVFETSTSHLRQADRMLYGKL